MCACLVITERYIFFDTLPSYIKHPFIIAYPCISPRFAAHRHALYTAVQMLRQIYRTEQWRRNYHFVLYRKAVEYRETIVGAILVLNRTADRKIIISVPPIVRNTIGETVDSFCKKAEKAVTTFPHHFPAVFTPVIGAVKKKIRGKTGIDIASRLYFIASVPFFLHGKSEILRFTANTAGYCRTVHLILTVHIAISASGTDLCASVPRIPVNEKIFFHLFSPSELKLHKLYQKNAFCQRCEKQKLPTSGAFVFTLLLW